VRFWGLALPRHRKGDVEGKGGLCPVRLWGLALPRHGGGGVGQQGQLREVRFWGLALPRHGGNWVDATEGTTMRRTTCRRCGRRFLTHRNLLYPWADQWCARKCWLDDGAPPLRPVVDPRVIAEARGYLRRNPEHGHAKQEEAGRVTLPRAAGLGGRAVTLNDRIA